MRFPSLILLACLAVGVCAQSGSNRSVPAIKIEARPAIDGDVSDACWQNMPELTGFWDTKQGNQVADQTKVKVAYDAKYIFISFDCFESKPDEIMARETQEDSRFGTENTETEDCVDVRLDPFKTGTFQASSIFSVNAIGTQSMQISGGRAKKTEWKGEWRAAVKRTPTGWTAEMQVPWQILNYPVSKFPQEMGINFTRYQFRTKTHSFFSNIGPNDREELQAAWQGVIAPQPPAPKVSVLPYVLPGINEKGQFTFRSGVDARYPITPEMTVVGSINPDFGTIEGAVESIGFSRTERRVAERRPFFLEGQNFFRPGESFDTIFFYPRRIETFDFGLKLFGKLTKNDSVGLLQALTFGGRADIVGNWVHQASPFERYGVFANFKHHGDEEGSAMSGNYYRQFGKLGTSTRLTLTKNNGAQGRAGNANIWWEDKNHSTFLSWDEITSDFELPTGLVGFTGVKGWSLFEMLDFEWKRGLFRAVRAEVFGNAYTNEDGDPFNAGYGVNFFSAFNKSDYAVRFQFDDFRYVDLYDRMYQLTLQKGWEDRFNKYGIGIGQGILSNEPASVFIPSFAKRISKGLDVAYQGYYQNWSGHAEQNILTASYEISPTEAFGSRLVSSNSGTNWYVSYRNSGKKGTEYFVILGDPNATKFKRQLQFKIVFAF